MGFPSLLVLMIGLEDKLGSQVGVGLKFLEVLLHGLILGTIMLNCIIDAGKLVDLYVFALGGE